MPFDDEDNPTLVKDVPASANGNTSMEDDGLEDDVPDYKLFMSVFEKRGVSSKTIRKGEKDFESHGTQAQEGTLETSRRALEEVLTYTRTHRSDAWVRGWYFPDFWASMPEESRPAGADQDGGLLLNQRVVVVEHERGNWMKDLGRTVSGGKGQVGTGRLWLLPEEALHLVERGNMDLWWPSKPLEDLIPGDLVPSAQIRDGFGPDDFEAGVPLSLEAAYSLLVGDGADPRKITLPKYQVFAHLKRGGFHVLRAANEPSSVEGSTTPSGSSTMATTLWQWMVSLFTAGIGAGAGTRAAEGQANNHKPYGPIISPGLYRAYRPIYEQLALIPRHKPTASPQDLHKPQDPFKVHYHVWKAGGAPFSKRSPPTPDFRIAVTDTETEGVPALEEIEALLESTPLAPPNETWRGHPGRMYQRLKHGHRNVLIAIVDRGLVNFMRFGEGAFGEEKLYERFDGVRGGRGVKKGGHGGVGRGRGGGRGGRGRGRGGRR